MSVRKTVERTGDSLRYPGPKQYVTISYHSWLHNPAAVENQFRGNQIGKPVVGVLVQLGTGMLLTACEAEIMKMSVGECSIFVIPASLAYGDEGIPGLIKPNVGVVVQIELLDSGTFAA